MLCGIVESSKVSLSLSSTACIDEEMVGSWA
jgi:hypothetical protein